MCLIAYSPDGLPVTRAVFNSACWHNEDGIGIMAQDDVARYVGRGAKKRAWSHIRRLNRQGIPFAVHWRYATHGTLDLDNCHPHETRNGVYVMHNGVLSGFDDKSNLSDTRQFINRHMWHAPSVSDWSFYAGIEDLIGYGNKFLVMDANGEFLVCNEHLGQWIGGIWYSNTYSLPDKMAAPYRKVYTLVKSSSELAHADDSQPASWWYSTAYATTSAPLGGGSDYGDDFSNLDAVG